MMNGLGAIRSFFGAAPDPPFNPLTATASDLQGLLTNGKVRSVQLANIYLDRIDKYNDYLRAVVSVVPKTHVLAQAKKLDDERAHGKVRGRLHGIPMLIKVTGYSRLENLMLWLTPIFCRTTSPQTRSLGSQPQQEIGLWRSHV